MAVYGQVLEVFSLAELILAVEYSLNSIALNGGAAVEDAGLLPPIVDHSYWNLINKLQTQQNC